MTSSRKLVIVFRHLSANFDLFEDFYLLISHSCSFPQTWQFRAGQSHATLDLFKILEFVIHTEASGLLLHVLDAASSFAVDPHKAQRTQTIFIGAPLLGSSVHSVSVTTDSS